MSISRGNAHQKIDLSAHCLLGMFTSLTHPAELMVAFLQKLAFRHPGQMGYVGEDGILEN